MTSQSAPRFDRADHLAAVAGYGLPGSLTDLPTESMPTPEWSAFLAEVDEHGIAGLLAAAIDAGAMPVSESQAIQAAWLQARAAERARLLDDTLADAIGVLDGAGIDALALGDSAVARLDYTNPGLRTVSDINVLVTSRQLLDAAATLVARGYVTLGDSSSQGVPARRRRGALRLRMHGGFELGLHSTLLPDRLAAFQVDMTSLWDRPEPFRVSGRTLEAPAREERLLHTCCRAALDSRPHRLGHRRDLAEATLHPRLDAQRAVALANQWGVEPILATAVRSAWSELRLADVVALSTWAETFDHDERWRCDTATHPNRPRRSVTGHLSESSSAALLRIMQHVPGMRRRW